MKKRIAITLGDPGGIGPEVAVKSAINPKVLAVASPILIGRKDVLKDVLKLLHLPLKIRSISTVTESNPKEGFLEIIETEAKGGLTCGAASASGGIAAYLAIERAVRLALSGEIDAICTAPISKESLKLAGLPWPGHTEMLAELTQTENYAMMLVGGGLRVILVTIHIPLGKVPSSITTKQVLKSIQMAKEACLMFGIETPDIAVAGLNPHAGESGMFGNEEERAIMPAIKRANAMGISASGPYPPDTVFYRALKGEFDIVVSMYHDQGLIPIKLLAFDTGVNVTVGLPIIRTSPDHGTAFDIAWKGLAEPKSMTEAIKLAASLRLPVRRKP